MAEVVPETNEQRLQNFLTESPWSHRALMDDVARQADQLVGRKSNSGLLIDECAIKKSGKLSVGSDRQWCGRLGKVDYSDSAADTFVTDDDEGRIADWNPGAEFSPIRKSTLIHGTQSRHVAGSRVHGLRDITNVAAKPHSSKYESSTRVGTAP